MTVTAAYATAEQYKNTIGITDIDVGTDNGDGEETSDTKRDKEILDDLTAISRYIDGRLGRFFSKDEEPVSRIYVPEENIPTLWVDDMAAYPVIVKLDTGYNRQFELILDPADYELLPYNADKGPEPGPFYQIQLLNSIFYSGVRVEVTAQFGWPEIPLAVQRATIHLTAILRLESPRATRRISELSEVIETSRDAQFIVKQLIEQYKVWRV